MVVSYDAEKRRWTLLRRQLDFEDADLVFAGDTFDVDDDRFDYGERRVISIGLLSGNAVVIVWTKRDDVRRIISMRKASRDERDDFWRRMGGP